jgi:type I restriction-modification system DNA methylase subunit
MIDFKAMANKIWSVADLLRGDYKQSDYGKIILPITVLRRLDCILAPTKQAVLDYLPKIEKLSEKFKKQIELFKEYRTTLISEVVTGKIDVRDEVAA